MTRFIFAALTLFCLPSEPIIARSAGISPADSTIEVPIAGNTYAQGEAGRSRLITNAGIENWSENKNQFDTYIRINRPGTIRIEITAKTDAKSELQISVNGKMKKVSVNSDNYQRYNAGEWNVTDTGYLKIVLSGISKTGNRFADVSNYLISGTAINTKTVYVKNNEGNFFYWGRRGPSVHLNYPFSDSIKAEWFYNEVTVPEKNDVIGSYFMAIGFGEGYFGIQVNSASERRILFSVWSPYTTDDPKSIPQDQRINMLKKGTDVYSGEFGNEGSGGQSYLRYNWKAGTTYKFLLRGQPDGNNNTTYTAWFFAPEKNEWKLIASFKRPKTNTYLKRFHSFLENFSPEQGDKERKVYFNNQWVGSSAGQWTELNKAGFTYDNTAAKDYRKDYAGGIENGKFFLKNCGFFSKYTLYKSSFEKPTQGKKPTIDFNGLP